MFLEFIKSDTFIIALGAGIIILLILFITVAARLSRLNKNYISFMKELGNGQNIDEMLRKYIDRVQDVEDNNKEISEHCSRLDKDMEGCLQKVGMVRYSAFKDTGSDLSFALALLDEHDNGVVLNGIYSREMSNIYAKQVTLGETTQKLTEEEREAIDIAMKRA
ncbi:MAG: DUF4446 family protein [Firmicutes bacterium]|nr:DUF4446 family protein [Bacillota bacterium]